MNIAVRPSWSAMFQRAHGWVLPPRCVLCLDPGRPPVLDLCPACEADLPLPEVACARCGAEMGEGVCARCATHPPPYAHAFAAFRYGWPVDALVRGFKYQKRLSHGRVLGTLLAEAALARGIDRPDALVPVPLHPARERERGYNQAWELARVAGRVLRVPVLANTCVRVRETPPQAGLDATARRTNVVDAFAVRRRVAGLHLAVVDDVMTTGATVAAVAAVMLAAGATRVDAWAVARA